MSSVVWKYFAKILDEKAKCTIDGCGAIVCRKGGSTMSMWAHLKAAHLKIHAELKEKEPSSTNSKMDDFCTKKIDEQDEADKLMASIMARRNESFSFVEDPGIQLLFSKAFPRLQVQVINL